MIELDKSRKLAAEIGLAVAARDLAKVDAGLSEPDVDWAYLLYFCDVHGLFGLLRASTTGVDDSRLPMRAAAMLERETDRQRRRWNAMSEMLVTLRQSTAGSDPALLLKGAALKMTIYREAPEQRQIGDVDILISENDEEKYLEVLRRSGYQIRKSKNGYTAIAFDPGAGRMVIDVHVDDTSKENRNPKVVYRAFQESSKPPVDGSLGYRLPSFEMSFLHGCKHFCEHADDFRKVLVQDDIRLFRLTDLILMLPLVDHAAVCVLAERLGWTAELWRALGYLSMLSDIPGEWSAASSESDLIETPVGMHKWPWPFDQRVLRLDRDRWMATLLGASTGRSDWYTSSKGARFPT
ncbi:nucleotidyltransferase family protein [Burkholderia ambifaria]|uniref:nucleotidyltransferase family protein n=1 Tax=Burkholderia ambifaria TaxID=152480 RepID=UPI0013DFACF5|nr:nucleotidyltransferase family protein [Burkholderia ambifaria]